MREILRRQIEAIRDQPVERLMKPAIKAVILIGILSTAAHYLTETYDRRGLARLTGNVVQVNAKAPAKRP